MRTVDIQKDGQLRHHLEQTLLDNPHLVLAGAPHCNRQAHSWSAQSYAQGQCACTSELAKCECGCGSPLAKVWSSLTVRKEQVIVLVRQLRRLHLAVVLGPPQSARLHVHARLPRALGLLLYLDGDGEGGKGE